MAGVQRLDMRGVHKLYMTGVQKLGVSDMCVIGQDTDMHTNIMCANIEPDTNSHGTTIKQVK